jgi:hypothetical protein
MTANREQRTTLISFLAALALMALSFAWTGTQVEAFSTYQMDLDEALHANRGLDIASAVRRGSLGDLWFETTKPHWYPPAHGYLLGAWFMLVGASVTTARMYAALCFFLLGLVLWASARQAFPETPSILWITPALFLLSDNQHLLYASLSMLDVPANLLAMAAMYFFLRSLRDSGPASILLTSFMAVVCFLTRYSHGIVLMAALAASYALLAKNEFKGRLMRVFLSWLPALLILFAWLVGLGEWKWLAAYADVQPTQVEAWSLQNLVFYPRQLLSESSGWLPILLTGLGILRAVRQRRFPRAMIPYLAFFIIALVLLSLRTGSTLRFGMILLPPIWIASMAGVSELFFLLQSRRFQIVAISTWLIFLLFLGGKNNLSLPAGLNTAYENTNTGVNEAYQFIAEKLSEEKRRSTNLVMYGETDQWNGFALHFFLQSPCMRTRPSCLVTVTGEKVLNKGWPPQNSAKVVRDERTQKTLAAADYLVLFAKTPVLPQGWVEIARREFVFDRYQVGPRNYQVVILHRALGG